MPCCESCFADEWMKQYIRDHAKDQGTCKYCRARGVPVVPVRELAPMFTAMMGLYRPMTSDNVDYGYENPLDVGDLPLQMIQDDWDVFSERVVEAHNAERLLENLANAFWD